MEIMGEFAELQLSTSGESDNAIILSQVWSIIIIIAYTDSEGLCVCCVGCDRWFNVECTTIKKKKLPDVYFCEDCIYKLIVITFLWYDSFTLYLWDGFLDLQLFL